MAQAGYLLAFPLESQVQSQTNSHEIFSGENGTGTLFFSTSVFTSISSHQCSVVTFYSSITNTITLTFDSIIKENISYFSFISKAMHTKFIKEVM
jgi:hypothetical protein